MNVEEEQIEKQKHKGARMDKKIAAKPNMKM